MASEKKKKNIIFTIIKCILVLVIIVVIAFLLVLGLITVKEYKPNAQETLDISGSPSKTLSVGDSVKAMIWNIGYGGLGEDADFFMDGGKGVNAESAEIVKANIDGVIAGLEQEDADIVMLQEVDIDSKRSYHVDENKAIIEALDPGKYVNTFAINYNVVYVPFPLPTIGKVYGGISTFSAFDITDSQRISLPSPFSYPLRVAQLKRCLNVNRIPVEGSDKELVLVNLHLEAYDDGEGKIAQTKLLMEVLDKENQAGNYVLAGGDFNQLFSSVDVSMYPLISEDLWQPGNIDVSDFKNVTFIADNSSPTCRSLDKPYQNADKENFQYYMIDGFIVSDNIEVKEAKTINLDFKNSDHNPVILEFTLH